MPLRLKSVYKLGMKIFISVLHKTRWILAALFIALFVYSALQAKQLKLKSDFKALLPDNFQSVRDLDRIAERVGSTGSLIVAIESPNPQDSIKFALALVAKLKEYPKDYIDTIEYNVADIRNFFEKNKYMYMDIKDLQEIYDRLDRKIQNEKLKKSGLLIDFQSDEEKKAFSTDDIEEKYKSKAGNYQDYTDGYFFGEGGKLLAVVIRPPGSSTGIDFSKKLVARVENTIADLKPATYNPAMKVGLTGKFKRVLFEYSTLVEDIVSTAVMCISLVGLCVFVYYKRFRMVALMAWATFNGVAWTFALTEHIIGFLTTQTAFLGSIIVGNGINYGLVLMARYLEERKAGKSALESLHISIPATLAGTLVSSLTTSVSFGVLLFTEIKGFTHFGFIGGFGMFACWVATYTVLPVFLMISEDIWPMKATSFFDKINFSFVNHFVTWLEKNTAQIKKTGLILTVVSIPLMIYFIPHSLEYDFSKLKVKPKGQAVSEESALNDRVKKIFGGSISPAVLVADRLDQVKPLCDEIKRKNELSPENERVIESCKTIYSYVPNDQDEKIVLLNKMRELVSNNRYDFLTDKQKAEIDKFKAELSTNKVKLEDLPAGLVKNFKEKNGDLGKVILVYSGDKVPLSKGQNLIHFADLISRNTLPNGEVITGSGDSAIFADILRAVIHDGPRTTIWAFIAVCLVVMVIFREKRGMVFIIGTLCFGVFWMGGGISLFDFKINFFNFIAIPTTFGIGVDYGVNIYQRYKLEGRGSIPKVLKTTGGAVALCSITTIIGYFTLIIAKNQALVSFGWIAIMGELTCILSAVVFIPAVVMIREKQGKM